MQLIHRFPLPEGTSIRPFIIAGPSSGALDLPHDVRFVDALSSAEADFCVAMNRANCLAYDGSPEPGVRPHALGMPPWVMLDCCVLPSAVFGFEVPRGAVPASFAELVDPGGRLEWIGVSEYIALPSVRTGEFVGVSLFSLAQGAGLGTRTKAFALATLRARRQIGVTQWSSPGVALHLKFGPLEVLSADVAIHSRPHETFVYALELPSAEAMGALALGEPISRVCEHQVHTVVDPRVDDVREVVRGAGGRVRIVGAGPIEGGELTSLSLSFVHA